MSVWKSDEKLLVFALLISPPKIICFRRILTSSIWLSVLSPDVTPRSSSKILPCASYFQLSSQCFIWWWKTASHAWYIYMYIYVHIRICIYVCICIHHVYIYTRFQKGWHFRNIYKYIYLLFFLLFRPEKQKIYIFLKCQPFWKRVYIHICIIILQELGYLNIYCNSEFHASCEATFLVTYMYIYVYMYICTYTVPMKIRSTNVTRLFFGSGHSCTKRKIKQSVVKWIEPNCAFTITNFCLS